MQIMRIHFIQHLPFEYPASVADWAANKNYVSTYTKLYENAVYPPVDSFEMLVIMGGAMGVYEEDRYAWMRAEKIFIRKAIEAKKKVLGICLGAQLTAEALGAKVFPHTLQEIGWLEVEKVAPHPTTAHLPQLFTTFHWHGDTFTLPQNAIQLFTSKGCAQQGFIYNDHVAALQFHMEVKEDLLKSMIDYEKSSLKKAGYVQTAEEINTLMKNFLPAQQQYIFGFLDAFAQL
jgi:GMP synthase (glutamine-hydrolysing)